LDHGRQRFSWSRAAARRDGTRPATALRLLPLIALAAGPAGAQTWVRAVGGPAFEQAQSVAPAADRGSVVAGLTDSFGAGGRDLLVARLSPCGVSLWQNSYGGGGDDQAFAAIAIPGGRFLLAGETAGFGGDLDLLLLEIDVGGAVSWQTALGGGGDERALAATALQDGGIAVAGSISGGGGTDVWVLRFDAARSLLWQTRYGGPGDEVPAAIRETPGGGFVVAGTTDSFGAGFLDGWLLQLDAAGGVEWERSYGGATDDGFSDAVVAAGGGFLAVGATDSFGAGLADAWVVRIDARGAILWQRVLGGVDDDEALAVVASGTGFGLAGWSRSFGPGDDDGWAAGIDASGAPLWQLRLGGAGSDALLDLAARADGGSILVGVSDSVGAGGADQWIASLDPAGATSAACGMASPASLPGATAGATSAATNSTIESTGAAARSPGWIAQPAAATSAAACAATPGEVSPPGAAEPLRFDDGVSLSWESAAMNCAETFNLYRGGLAALPAGDHGTCLSSGLSSPAADDLDVPSSPGEGFVYLVTATAEEIEGTAGTSSDGAVRMPSMPCR